MTADLNPDQTACEDCDRVQQCVKTPCARLAPPVDGQVDERRWWVVARRATGEAFEVHDDGDEARQRAEDAWGPVDVVEAVPASERDRLVAAEREMFYLKCEAERGLLDLAAEHETLQAENQRLKAFAFGDRPEWEKANATLKHEARELRATIDRAAVLAAATLRDRREPDKVAAYAQEMVLLTERSPAADEKSLNDEMEADHGH